MCSLTLLVTAVAILPQAAAQENGEAEGAEGGEAKPEGEEKEAEPVDEAAQEQATDDLALTIIMGIVSSRPAQPQAGEDQTAAAAAASDKRDDRRGSHRGGEATTLPRDQLCKAVYCW